MSKTKFRKGERVIDTRKPPLVAATYEGMTGTVTNPTPDCGYIRIRLDNQQPCERASCGLKMHLPRARPTWITSTVGSTRSTT